MRSIQKFFGWVLVAAVLALTQIIWSTYWPSPFNYINIVFAGLTVWLLFTDDKIKFFQIVLVIYWLFEILSPAPYGINLVSAFISFILLERLSSRVFTGHSAQTVILLSVIGMVAFRACYITISLATGFLNAANFTLPSVLLTAILWEIIFTTIAAWVIFLVAVFGIRRFNPRYVLMDKKIFYG